MLDRELPQPVGRLEVLAQAGGVRHPSRKAGPQLQAPGPGDGAGRAVTMGNGGRGPVPRPPLTSLTSPARQVFVSCNFCGKSISYSCSATPHQGRGFSQYGVSGSPTKSKVTSCPGCRKPLPRCALCLMNMGTPVSNCPGKTQRVDWPRTNPQVVHRLSYSLKGCEGQRSAKILLDEENVLKSL